MIIVNIEQNSPEWFDLRSKRMTASHAQAISANGKGLETYINGLMQNYYSSAEPDNYKSKSMERGNELESSAVFAYESETGCDVERVGFVIHDEFSGCSPDGFSEDGLVEIKCLEDKAYFQYLLDEKIDTKYYWQMQMQMYICEKDWCDYVVYNPNFKKSLIIKRISQDRDKFKKILVGIDSGTEKIKTIQSQFEGILK